MTNNVQKMLNILYNIAINDSSMQMFDIGKNGYGYVDNSKLIDNFNRKEIYDELSDFAFLALYYNSKVQIDSKVLNNMVKNGVFERLVNGLTFEGAYLKEVMQKSGVKTSKGIEITDEFGQKSIVSKEGKHYLVTTHCPKVVSVNYRSKSSVDPDIVVNIIRNSLIHNRFREVSEEEKKMYSETFKEYPNDKVYFFKNYNNSVDILVTDSWLREFKKVFFLDSYCYVSNQDNVFYFPRIVSGRSEKIKDVDDLEKVLETVVHTKVVINDDDKNFMNTRVLIEEKIYNNVFSRDKRLKFTLKNKSKEELKEYLKFHHKEIEDYIVKVLNDNGYKDFTIEFSGARNDANFDKHVEFWKKRVEDIYDFYGCDSLEEQMYYINRSCGIIANGGFNKKENVKGITPQMISLFLSTIQSIDKAIIKNDKIDILNEVIKNNKFNLSNFVLEKIRQTAVRGTDSAIDHAFSLVSKAIDVSDYEKVTVRNFYDSFNGNCELAYVVGCASIYNGLIRSGFYEKVLKKSEDEKFPRLDKESFKLVSELDMSQFSINNKGKSHSPENYGEKMWVLSYLRNILLHGGAEIDYTSITGKNSETKIKFKSDNTDVEVFVTIDNLVKVFNSPLFYNEVSVERRKSVNK